MRGVRGGFKDQIKAFREFLLRKKMKKKKEEELLRLRNRKKKKRIDYFDNNLNIDFNLILQDIYKGVRLNYAKVYSDLECIKNDKKNAHLLDIIEEVSEKVELEIMYNEIIIKDDFIVIDDGLVNFDEKVKENTESFISLCNKYINKSDDVNVISHYYNNIFCVYNKHVEERKKYKDYNCDVVDELITDEKQVLDVAGKKVKQLDSNYFTDDVFVPRNFVNDILSTVEIENDNYVNAVFYNKKSINNKNAIKKDEFLIINDNLDEYIMDKLNNEKKNDFDFSEFDIVNQTVSAQILMCEDSVNQLRSQVADINNLFKDKGFVEKIFEFTRNTFNLGKGLIGKYVFKNKLIGRLNNEILINNSLKAIHRVFVPSKQEVPYIVFKSFEKDINDKKDCVAKIIDICDDSLTEIISMKKDFFSKYGDIDDEQVKQFIDKINQCEQQILSRKAQVKKIENEVLKKYRENMQKVKIKK